MASRGTLTWSLAAVVLAVPLAGCGSSGTARPDARQAAVKVKIDVRARRQRIDGFGSSERVWSDPHLSKSPNTSVPAGAQDAILTALYRRLGLTRVRNVLDQGIQRTPGGPFNFSGKLTDDHVAFVHQAQRYGLKTYFPEPVYLESWMTPEDPGAYVDWAMAVLERWRSRGAEPPLYAPLNEPQVARNFPPDWLRKVVVELGGRLRAAGFRTRLVIPDDENPIDAYRRAEAVLADPQARKYVAALAYHVYRIGGPADYARLRRLAARYGLPVWMTEYQEHAYATWPGALGWAVKMHELLTVGGVSAIDYLWGFFGDWTREATLVSINFDGGAYRGHSLMPTYYLTGQFSRFVRPGYRRVKTSPADAGPVLTSAFTRHRRLVVVAINTASAPADLRLSIRGARLRGSVSSVRTSQADSWTKLPPRRARGRRLSARLGAQSVTTFVARTAPPRRR